MADEHRMPIGGSWVGSESGAIDATSPSTGEVIGSISESQLPFGGRAGPASGFAWVGGRFSIEWLIGPKTIVVDTE